MPALWVTIVLLALATAYSAFLVSSKRRVPLWLIVVFAVLFMFGFLTWAASGAAIPVIGLLFGSLSLAVPLIYGSLAGVLGERVGVINIAIEGQLLAGAFTAAVVASITGQPLARAGRRDGRRTCSSAWCSARSRSSTSSTRSSSVWC